MKCSCEPQLWRSRSVESRSVLLPRRRHPTPPNKRSRRRPIRRRCSASRWSAARRRRSTIVRAPVRRGSISPAHRSCRARRAAPPSKDGRAISKWTAAFDELGAPSKFGSEYLTYVLWAITPEGRANNLGELQVNGNDGKLRVTTELQAFGLIVTAEPYFAVTQPSDVVVMENIVRDDTEGRIQTITAKYELLKRGSYLMNGDTAKLKVKPLEPGCAAGSRRGAQRRGAGAHSRRGSVRGRHVSEGRGRCWRAPSRRVRSTASATR